jgi:hypothetical protein
VGRRGLPLLSALAAFVTGACLTVRAPTVSSERRVGQSANDPFADAIPWSAARRLEWSDFRAKPSHDLVGAEGIINYAYTAGCRGGFLRWRIEAMFLPHQSSVAHLVVSSGRASRVGLQHEQIHFDLAEIYARRARKFLRELPNPCPRSDDELLNLVEGILREAAGRQRRYDADTDRGQNGAQQAEWAAAVARELAALQAHRDCCGSRSAAF